jgi:pimeloyl-ACP methyl ester carboxylesterase
MQHQLLSYKNSRISYYFFGSGPRLAFCFHGYGEDGASYSFLERLTDNQFTFIALDLPFHGKTDWKEGLNFASYDLNQIIAGVFNDLKLQVSNSKFTLIGFSLGGRIALSYYQSRPEKVEKMVLLAPDGLKENFWYWLSTQTWLGNKLFAFTMKYPGWFFGLLKIINSLGLVNSSVFKFINYYIGDAAIRKLLYERWTSLRKLTPDLNKINSLIHTYKTTIKLVYGKHDKIILPIRGEQFKKGIEGFCTVKIIESGHQVLHEKHAEEIITALLQ